jgi:SAM-dependent methyltransferase
VRDAALFAERWAALRERDADAERAFWDGRADEFNELVRVGDGPGDESPVDFLLERGAVFPGASVLDVGCGTGRHALRFAAYGARVVGLDLSPRMIGHAEANALAAGLDLRFVVMPWETADIDVLGFAGAFDLAVAVRSPAICSLETLRALCRVSRGYCFLSAFIHRDDMLLAPLAERFAPGRMPHRHKGGALYAFNILRLLGYRPELRRRDAEWTRMITREEALALCARAFGSYFGDAGTARNAFAALLPADDGDGMLRRTVRAETAWMLWKVRSAQGTGYRKRVRGEGGTRGGYFLRKRGKKALTRRPDAG